MELPEDLDLGYSPALMAATDFIKDLVFSATPVQKFDQRIFAVSRGSSLVLCEEVAFSLPDITSPEKVSQEASSRWKSGQIHEIYELMSSR